MNSTTAKRTTRSIDCAIRPYYCRQPQQFGLTSLIEKLDCEVLSYKPHPSLSPSQNSGCALRSLPSTKNSDVQLVKLRVKKQKYKKMAADLKHLLKLRDQEISKLLKHQLQLKSDLQQSLQQHQHSLAKHSKQKHKYKLFKQKCTSEIALLQQQVTNH